MTKLFFGLAALLGFLGVALGAFGAHALKARLSGEMLAVYQTGVQYHLIHALALGLAAVAIERWPHVAAVAAGWLFLAGIVLFSGSLYALATSGITKLGMITPLGGLCFLAGWAALAWTALRA